MILFSATVVVSTLYVCRSNFLSCDTLPRVNPLSFAPSGAGEHRQRDVFRAPRSRRLRNLLQPPGGPRPLLHHRLQLLRGDARRDASSHPEGNLVSATGAARAYCVELLLPNRINPLFYTWGEKNNTLFS